MRKIVVLVLLAVSFVGPVFASDYGCKVLLCLASPGQSPAECSPPLNRLWFDLSHGRRFPSCEEAGDSTNIKQGRNYYEDCRDPYTLQVTVHRGGEIGDDVYYGEGAESQRRGSGQCIDLRNPIVQVVEDDGKSYNRTTYRSYPVGRRAKYRYIDVFVDGQFMNRSYW